MKSFREIFTESVKLPKFTIKLLKDAAKMSMAKKVYPGSIENSIQIYFDNWYMKNGLVPNINVKYKGKNRVGNHEYGVYDGDGNFLFTLFVDNLDIKDENYKAIAAKINKFLNTNKNKEILNNLIKTYK